MSRLTVEDLAAETDAIHRDLARLSVDRVLGTPSALSAMDVLRSHPVFLRPKTWEYLRKALKAEENSDRIPRIERLLYACMDLTVEDETASLSDMLNFYMERGRMHVDSDKIPAVEVVPWLQSEPDFHRREQMQKESTIWLKGIVNPMLLAMLELTVRAVSEKFGFENYSRFCEAKKEDSFDDRARDFRHYLDRTEDAYRERIVPWAEEVIGRPFDHLSRYHALYLLRIRTFDAYFPISSLKQIVEGTFKGLGFDLSSRPDVVTDISDHPSKNPRGLCVGVEIPGEIYVLMKPMGGLIDVETLLHETGHAFFLSHFDPNLPLEYRRLYRSAALDETYAFLFMDLIGNRAWLTGIAGMPPEEADRLANLYRTKRLCLIRRYIGKFLAELELHASGNIKNSEPYCRHLHRATGFTYEPEGYLIDMEPDFYALDYLNGWAGSAVLGEFLEARFGSEWFAHPQAGAFLKEIAASGRKDSLETTLISYCGAAPRLPEFSVN
jgi:AraC-like DNA-binding protein